MDITVQWKPYELGPQLPKYKGVDKRQRYIDRFGESAANAGAKRLKASGSRCSPKIEFEFDGLIGNTFDSHRLVMLAGSQGKEHEAIEVVMHYYFELNKDIADHAVLAEIGRKVGLSKVEEFLKGDQFAKEVSAELKRAKQMGVTGVPTFIINDDYKKKFSGAQPPDALLAKFKQYL